MVIQREADAVVAYIRVVVAATGVKFPKQLYNFRAVTGRIVGPSDEGRRRARFALPLALGAASSFGELCNWEEGKTEIAMAFKGGRIRWRKPIV